MESNIIILALGKDAHGNQHSLNRTCVEDEGSTEFQIHSACGIPGILGNWLNASRTCLCMVYYLFILRS